MLMRLKEQSYIKKHMNRISFVSDSRNPKLFRFWDNQDFLGEYHRRMQLLAASFGGIPSRRRLDHPDTPTHHAVRTLERAHGNRWEHEQVVHKTRLGCLANCGKGGECMYLQIKVPLYNWDCLCPSLSEFG